MKPGILFFAFIRFSDSRRKSFLFSTDRHHVFKVEEMFNFFLPLYPLIH